MALTVSTIFAPNRVAKTIISSRRCHGVIHEALYKGLSEIDAEIVSFSWNCVPFKNIGAATNINFEDASHFSNIWMSMSAFFLLRLRLLLGAFLLLRLRFLLRLGLRFLL